MMTDRRRNSGIMQSVRAPTISGGATLRRLLVFGVIVGALFLLVRAPSVRADDIPPPALKHGINLSNWFADAGRQPLTARDFAQIMTAGFDHVRIPVNPESLGFSLSEGSTGRVLFDFSNLDLAVGLARDRGLSVIIDIHPSDNFMAMMDQDPRGEAGLIALWQHLAEHYKPFSTSTVVFELLNEPRYAGDTAKYRALVTDIVRAIRDVAPKNTIIVDIPKSATIEGFDGFTPVKDDNVLYAFHFYDPFIVTHQGMKAPPARGRALRYFHNLPYPVSAVDPNVNYAPGAPDSIEAKRELADYVAGGWDSAHIAARIKIATSWAVANHQQVICTEFGATRRSLYPVARYEWIADVRRALEADHIGWDLWDYTDLFGITKLTGDTITDPGDGSVRLADPDQGSRDIEPDAVRALFVGR
jgi:endoglucanase